MKGDEKHGLENKCDGSGRSRDDCGYRSSETALLSLFPQRGTLKDSKWREAVMFLSDFSHVPALGMKIGILFAWAAGVAYFLVYTYWSWTPLIVWLSSGFGVALWLNIRSHSHFDVEKERRKTRRI